MATTFLNLNCNCCAVLEMDSNDGDAVSSHASCPWPEEAYWSTGNDGSEEGSSPAFSLDSHYLEPLSPGPDESMERVLAQCCEAEENDVSEEVPSLPLSEKDPWK